MSCTPLLSDIISVRNHSAVFEEPVASIRAQSRSNDDRLVVDDGGDELERARIAVLPEAALLRFGSSTRGGHSCVDSRCLAVSGPTDTISGFGRW